MCGGEGRWIMSMNLLLEHLLHKVHTSSSSGRHHIIISLPEKRNAKAKKKEAGKTGKDLN
jgi:hypothetical protein